MNERVELFVSAKNLTDVDILTLSDPLCQLFMKNGNHDSYVLVGETETIDNNLNPKWVKHFTVNYYFERQQLLMFKVYDDDGDMDSRQLIGLVEILLSEVITAPKCTVLCPLINE